MGRAHNREIMMDALEKPRVVVEGAADFQRLPPPDSTAFSSDVPAQGQLLVAAETRALPDLKPS